MRFGSVLRLRPLGLHPATWLVGLLAAALFLFIAIPGEPIPASDSLDSPWWAKQRKEVGRSLSQQFRYQVDEANLTVTPSTTELFEHGWPRRCAIRGYGEMLAAQPYTPTFGPYGNLSFARPTNQVRSWKRPASWPLQNPAWSIHYGNLAINLALLALAVAAAMWATERWVRKRGGMFRFRLIDYLAIIAVVAGALGWLKYHEAAGRTEQRIAEEAEGARQWRYSVYRNYAGPDWLRRLAGGAEFLPLFDHATRAQLRVGRPWQQDIATLQRLPYLERLTVEGAITRDLITQLEDYPRLRSLSLHFAHPRPDELERLGIAEPDLMTSGDLPMLGELSLDTVELWNLPLELKDVEDLLAILAPNELLIDDRSFSAEEFERLRRKFSGVEIKTH